jgi:dTDP-4-amino-4,6-dideoxygalactose transaminase
VTATIKPANTAEAIPFLDLVAQHRTLEQELVDAFRRALRSAAFIGGPEVESFEDEFAAFVDTRYAVAVNSGTDALRFAYIAHGVRPGDEVITVAHTFIATTEALTQAGATFRFVDIDDSTMTLDPAQLESAITERTVGIVPVHLYGQPADMDAITRIADAHGLWVIEDAAQAHGALYKGRPCGSLAPMAAFSFYPGKNLGACGEGGAVTGIDPERIGMVRRLRDHGQAQKYYHDSEGYNGRLDAIQAAILRIKLRHLRDWTDKRRRAAELYGQALGGIAEIRVPDEAPYARHVYHLYVIRAQRRDDLQRYLTERRIATGMHYPVPLHLQRAYAYLGLSRGTLPATEACADTILSLPMFPEITESQVARVADTIREFYHRG